MRLKYHFEPKKGWMNDPNGLIFFRGRYHAFFQHNPHAAVWGPMHWGHAVSDDLIRWEELPIALYPDQPYEDNGGCFSGSAIEKDGKLYLFYTSVSKALGQTQSVAISEDGLNFTKYAGNPLIKAPPTDGSADFRDPKVTLIDGVYYMVCGSGRDGAGKILLFRSDDLFDWKYVGVLFEGAEYGRVLECPDFFKLGDRYVLMFSQMELKTHSSVFAVGDFDGSRFTPSAVGRPEAGPHFYAPQSFWDGKRRIVVGWMYSWDKPVPPDNTYTGAFSLPRELHITDGDRVLLTPVSEAERLLTPGDPIVHVSGDLLTIDTSKTSSPVPLSYRSDAPGDIPGVSVLRDTKTLEVFINGRASFTVWLE